MTGHQSYLIGFRDLFGLRVGSAGAEMVKLWPLLLPLCFAMLLGGALPAPRVAQTGPGGCGMAATIGLSVGACCHNKYLPKRTTEGDSLLNACIAENSHLLPVLSTRVSFLPVSPLKTIKL